MKVTIPFNYCVKNFIAITFITLSLKWEAEAIVKSSAHEEITRVCRTVLESLEKTVYKNFTIIGEKHLTVVCSGPGGKEEITLPVHVTAAKKLINLHVLDPKANTVVIMHGFNDSPEKDVPSSVGDAYYTLGQHNVLQIDSSKVTSRDFFRSVHASQEIGNYIAKFLHHLYLANIIHPSKLHFVGLSLGSHSASGTARMFEKYTAKKIARITGVDPPGLCYEYRSEELSKNDAEYVDIIHTNQGFQGMMGVSGHSDYFINGGGPSQPGCIDHTCAHKRAGYLYAETVLQNSAPFYARKCDSLFSFRAGKCDNNEISTMGINSNISSRGFYYLRTKDESPFSLGMKGTKSESNKLFYIVLREIAKIIPNDISKKLG